MRMPPTGRITASRLDATDARIARLATGFAFGCIMIGCVWTEAAIRVNLSSLSRVRGSAVVCLLALSMLTAGRLSGFQAVRNLRLKAVRS